MISTSWECFKVGFFISMGVGAFGVLFLMVWGLYDIMLGIVASIKLAWRMRKEKKGAPVV